MKPKPKAQDSPRGQRPAGHWLKRRLKRPRPVPSVWRLLRHSLTSYSRHWTRFIAITVIVALPYGLLGLTAGSAPSDTLTAYGSFAALIMNLALIWAVVRLEAGEDVSVKTAYYHGTATLIRFVLVTLVLVLQTIPLIIGAVFFSNATIGSTTATTVPERLLVGLLWLLLALPSLYWLTRYIFALFAASDPEMTPVLSLRTSRLAVKGHAWAVFGRLAAITIILMLATLLPTAAALLWVPPRFTAYGLAALQLLVSLTLLPVLYLYLYKLYRSLA